MEPEHMKYKKGDRINGVKVQLQVVGEMFQGVDEGDESIKRSMS